MNNAMFTCGCEAYAGVYDDAVSWNGYKVPYFTREVGEQIIADMSRGANNGVDSAHYDAARDAFVIKFTDSDEPDIMDVSPNGLYAIGGFSWTWMLDETNNAHTKEGN